VAASTRRADELDKMNDLLPFLNPDAVFVCSGSRRPYCEWPRDSVVLAVAIFSVFNSDVGAECFGRGIFREVLFTEEFLGYRRSDTVSADPTKICMTSWVFVSYR
jgi:hypothetical protein